MCHTLKTWPSKEGLRIGYLNINHALNKLTEMSSILHNSGKNFHMFCFAESRLSDRISDSDVSVPGYNVIRRDSELTKETGLLLYFNQSVILKRLSHLESFQVESIWVETKVKHSKPLIIGFIYRNPAERIDWFDNFNLMMDAATLENKEIILLGDFNIDLLKPQSQWIQLYQTFGLHQLIDTATRITDTSETLIDHIYTTSKENIVEISSPILGCSDHSPVCITWLRKGVKIPRLVHKVIRYRCFKNFDEDKFLLELLNSPLSQVYQYTDPDRALEFWLQIFTFVYDKHAPFKTKRVRYHLKPPWLSEEIEQAIHLRDSLKAKKHQDFKKQRNIVTSMIRTSKKKYFQSLAASKQNCKSVWNAINILTNKGFKKSPTVTKDISPDKLNDHFANLAEKLITDDKWKENDLETLREFCQSRNIETKLSIPYITVPEVYAALSHLKQSSTKDLNLLDGKIIKLSAPVISDTLTYIYNLCIDENYFPSIFKQAKVIPLFKSGDPSNPSNYRPISILSILSKPPEKHMNKHLISHLNKYNLIHSNQSGFRENYSCHTALIQMIDKWLQNINNSEFTGVVFADLAKAFDVINHALLLKKLELHGISDNSLQLITSFLLNRTQLVNVNGSNSDFLSVRYGVPQGSVLGPLLFSLYINDLPLYIDGSCELFADDNSIHTSHSSLSSVSSNLQESVNRLVDWTHLNHMSLNPQKTKCMCITTRQKRQKQTTSLPSICISNETTDEVKSHKVLGITIDNNLSWSDHISLLCKKVSQKLFQLSKIKHFLDVHARKLFFHAHIQSLIDYASTLWDSASANILKPLESLYKRAIKLILLKPNSLTTSDYTSTDILPLKLRLEYNKAVMMHRVMTGKAPPNIRKDFPLNVVNHSKRLVLPLPRIDLFKSSFKYSGANCWNNLSASLKTIHSQQSFKILLKMHLMYKIK